MTDPDDAFAPVNGGPLFEVQRRVRLHDTDASGLIFFGTVFAWANDVLSDWLSSLDHPLAQMLAEGTGLPAVHAEASYLAPLGVDDELRVQLREGKRGRTSLLLEVSAVCTGDAVEAVRVRSTHVYTRFSTGGGPTPRPQPEPLPGWLVEGLGRGTG